MAPLQKKKYINSVKSDLLKEREEKLKTFTTGNEKAQQFYEQAKQSALSELSETLPKMVNKKYKSLLITPEMANKIEQFVKQSPKVLRDENGNFVAYDIKKSITGAVSELFFDDIVKAAIDLGRTMGASKALESRIRSNKNLPTSGVAPSTQKTEQDIFDESSKKQWERRGFRPIKK